MAQCYHTLDRCCITEIQAGSVHILCCSDESPSTPQCNVELFVFTCHITLIVSFSASVCRPWRSVHVVATEEQSLKARHGILNAGDVRQDGLYFILVAVFYGGQTDCLIEF